MKRKFGTIFYFKIYYERVCLRPNYLFVCGATTCMNCKWVGEQEKCVALERYKLPQKGVKVK